MVDAVRGVKSQLESMRTTQAFDTLFNASLEAAKRLDLDDLEVPRRLTEKTLIIRLRRSG